MKKTNTLKLFLLTTVMFIMFSLQVSASTLPEVYNAAGNMLSISIPNQEELLSVSSKNKSSSDDMIPLGSFRLTAYCPCFKCSEGWGRHTGSGAIAAAGRTVAVDTRVIPYGSRLMINGHVYTAEDKGGGVKGNHIDIFFNTHAETVQFGTQYADVYLLP